MPTLRVRWLDSLNARLRSSAIVPFTVLLFAVPALCDLLSSPAHASYRWIAGDTFYYLTVARNFARHGVLAYDGVHGSNGFQPLWQLWSIVTEFVRERLGLGMHGLLLLTLSGLALIAGAIGLLGATLRRARRLSVLFLFLPVGVYGLSVAPAWRVGFRPLIAHGNWDWLMPVFGTPWSYVNGMESALLLFFYALALYLASKPESYWSVSHAAYFGLALAGITLARLDHGFFSVALLLAYVLLCQRARPPIAANTPYEARLAEFARGLQLPIIAGLVSACCVVPYLLQNRYFYGNFVPLSGVAKSTFPRFSNDMLRYLTMMFDGRLRLDDDWWIQIACRVLQVVLPALYCVIYLLIRAFRRTRSPLTTLLTASAFGALVLSAYDFSFTPTIDQGYWYMPVSTLLPTLFLLNARPFVIRESNRAQPLFAVALTVTAIAFFFFGQRHLTYNHNYAATVLQNAVEARAHYRNQLPKVIEIDDGIVGYALDTPAHSSFLALDPRGFAARRQGHLLELMLARGFDRVASATYRPPGTSDEQLATWLGGSLGQDVSQYRVQREFVSADGLLVIAKITPR